jgi:hypothetical protein
MKQVHKNRIPEVASNDVSSSLTDMSSIFMDHINRRKKSLGLLDETT